MKYILTVKEGEFSVIDKDSIPHVKGFFAKGIDESKLASLLKGEDDESLAFFFDGKDLDLEDIKEKISELKFKYKDFKIFIAKETDEAQAELDEDLVDLAYDLYRTLSGHDKFAGKKEFSPERFCETDGSVLVFCGARGGIKFLHDKDKIDLEEYGIISDVEHVNLVDYKIPVPEVGFSPDQQGKIDNFTKFYGEGQYFKHEGKSFYSVKIPSNVLDKAVRKIFGMDRAFFENFSSRTDLTEGEIEERVRLLSTIEEIITTERLQERGIVTFPKDRKKDISNIFGPGKKVKNPTSASVVPKTDRGDQGQSV